MSTGKPFVLWYEACHLGLLEMVGGKNARLGELIQGGFPVPNGFAVTTAAFTAFLEGGPGRELRKILGDRFQAKPGNEAVTSRKIRHLIQASQVPEAVAVQMKKAYAELCKKCGHPRLPVAIRSSATTECLDGYSFAGQQETYLGVHGQNALMAQTLRCWSSLFTPQAMAYRGRMKFSHLEAQMSVGVQQLAVGEASGVIFTLNPANGDRSKIVVEANWGLGESVVDGSVDPDRFVVDKVTLEIIERVVAKKEWMTAVDDVSGVKRMRIPSEKRGAACLSDVAIIELATLAKKIERHRGSPQDIEWTRLTPPNGNVILQSRPETAWCKRSRHPVVAPQTSGLGVIVEGMKILGKSVGKP